MFMYLFSPLIPYEVITSMYLVLTADIKIVAMKIYPASKHLFVLRPKYFLPRRVFENTQPVYIP